MRLRTKEEIKQHLLKSLRADWSKSKRRKTGMKDQRPRIRRKSAECEELLRLNRTIIENHPDLWYGTLAFEYGNYLDRTKEELNRWRQRLSEIPA